MAAGKKRRKPAAAQPRRARSMKTADAVESAESTPPAPVEVGPEESKPLRPGPPVAGIGASAGGLDAFKRFFTAAPADSGVAYVLIPHLDPKHESLMAQLLTRYTRMPVAEAENGVQVEANHVYIIPANKYMTIADGILRLSGPVSRSGPQTSIDLFLRSLGEDKQEKAIGIVLSGTGAHGALGLKAVKAAGGLAMVQDPETTEYPAMPRSAIATGLADFILPVEQMPEALINYVRHSYVIGGKAAVETAGTPDHLNQVLALLRVRTKLDFRHYRKKMLQRRIERRMSLSHFDQLADYLAYVREHPDELQQLARDLLISVTSFFRDPEAWQALETEVIGPLVRAKPPDTPIRIWSAGCATGEEAYSLGMLVLEQMAAAQKSCPVQIFASDVDDAALDVARHAVYSDNISTDVSPERLSRFFTRINESTYQVSKQLRETVIFAHQNLISDAPFSRLDLIVCRNLLIYLEADVQRKVISLLHFALRDDGFLFLGPSETIGRQTDLLEPVSKKWRIYRRIGPARRERVEFPIAAADPSTPAQRAAPRPTQFRPVNLPDLMQRLLVEKFAPASVLINRKYEILCYSGAADRYLAVSAGLPTLDLLEMAREGLRTKLRAAIHKALRENVVITLSHVQLKRSDQYYDVNVEIAPAQDSGADGMLLITFSDAGKHAGPSRRPKEAASNDSVVRQLEDELKATKEDLQTTIEELESSNEELKASNEEVMSMNEELQSANEELETSKEELQSLNEELSTVNNQLQDKVQDLESANNDISNLFNCTDIATIFLDTDLYIRRYTPAAVGLFKVIASDVGRPIGDVVRRFTDDDFLRDVQQMLRDLAPREKEVQTDYGRWCIRRIVPYRTVDNRIAGIVITFVDITERKQAVEAVVRRLAAIVESSADAIFSNDLDGTVRTWNKGAERLYGYTADEIIGHSILVSVEKERVGEWKEAMNRLGRGEDVEQIETECLSKDGRRVPVAVTYSPIRNAEGKVQSVSAIVRDITERIRTEQAVRASGQRLAAILTTAVDAIITIDSGGIIQSVNPATEQMFGYAAAEMVGQNVKTVMPSPYREEHDRYLARYLQTGKSGIIGVGREVQGQRKDGSVFPVDLVVSEVEPKKLFTGIVRDITRRKQLEREVLEIAMLEQSRIGQEIHDDLGQQVTGLSMLAEALAQHLGHDASPHKDTAGQLAAGLGRLRQLAQRLSRGLVPTEVGRAGLRAALQELVTRTCEQAGVACTLDFPGEVSARDDATATHLLRIAQEAVNNAVRHSQANNVQVHLVRQAEAILLSIRDNGVGIAELPKTHEGIGIRLMRNRAGLIGGRLEIGPAAGGGTLVTCTVPEGIHDGQN